MSGSLRSGKPAIQAVGVWKVYNEGTHAEVRALQDVNLKVHRGDFVVVQGPSGSGKSTLLHMIGCLDTPTRGKIYIEGKDVSRLSEDELALVRREKLGFVFQKFNLIPTLTALQNVEMPMLFNGVEGAKREEMAAKLLESVGLGRRMHHRPSELSGGETQRVAIARALANDPLIVLADEPTGNLDTKSGEEIIKILKKLNEEEGHTVVIITHDPEIAQCAKKKLRIRDGMLLD